VTPIISGACSINFSGANPTTYYDNATNDLVCI
jgi:hypothetical protein